MISRIQWCDSYFDTNLLFHPHYHLASFLRRGDLYPQLLCYAGRFRYQFAIALRQNPSGDINIVFHPDSNISPQNHAHRDHGELARPDAHYAP